MEEYGNYISVALLPLLAILQPHMWKNFDLSVCANRNYTTFIDEVKNFHTDLINLLVIERLKNPPKERLIKLNKIAIPQISLCHFCLFHLPFICLSVKKIFLDI